MGWLIRSFQVDNLQGYQESIRIQNLRRPTTIPPVPPLLPRLQHGPAIAPYCPCEPILLHSTPWDTQVKSFRGFFPIVLVSPGSLTHPPTHLRTEYHKIVKEPTTFFSMLSQPVWDFLFNLDDQCPFPICPSFPRKQGLFPNAP